MFNFDGFLPSRASLMMDIVVVAMFVVLPVLAASVLAVRYRRRYALHKRLQLVLGGLLLVAVVLFELEIRIYGWRERAEASPYYGPVEDAGPLLTGMYSMLGWDYVPGWVFTMLGIHLVFAITTPVLWIWVTVQALRKFPSPPTPSPHSRSHIFWGQLAAIDMAFTTLTGWVFYWMAFVA